MSARLKMTCPRLPGKHLARSLSSFSTGVWESAKTGTGHDGAKQHPAGTGQCLATPSLLSKLIKGQEKGTFFAKSLIWQDVAFGRPWGRRIQGFLPQLET